MTYKTETTYYPVTSATPAYNSLIIFAEIIIQIGIDPQLPGLSIRDQSRVFHLQVHYTFYKECLYSQYHFFIVLIFELQKYYTRL